VLLVVGHFRCDVVEPVSGPNFNLFLKKPVNLECEFAVVGFTAIFASYTWEGQKILLKYVHNFAGKLR